MGAIGLSKEDFCSLTPEEYRAVCREYNNAEERRYKTSWEVARMQALIAIKPYTKKNITPQQLLPFPWEEKKERRKTEILTKEEAEKRLLKRLAKNGNTHREN